MRFQLLAAVLTALASSVVAVPSFTLPAAGTTEVAATAFSVTWAEDSTQPLLTALDTYIMYIGVGGNTAGTYEKTKIATGSVADLTKSVTVPVTVPGTTTANAYFIVMISTGVDGGTLTSFSNRFSMTGLTGTISTVVKTGLATISGTTGPDGSNDGVAVATTASVAETGSFTIPYYLQTGLIKYAPMQPVPGTKITAKSYSRLYPTSAYTMATTYMPIASITLTITDSQTFSVSSAENTVAAAQTRTKDDMGNWLKRWAD